MFQSSLGSNGGQVCGVACLLRESGTLRLGQESCLHGHSVNVWGIFTVL